MATLIAPPVPVMDTNVVVKFDHVNKFFGSLHVLNDINLEVKKNETLVIIGPSGSGKSTMLRSINHLENINSGHIYINGRMIGYYEKNGRLYEESEKNISRQRAGIGMVFQRFNLFPHLTALENIMESPLNVLKMPKETAKAEAIRLLQRVGLTDKCDSYPSQLSGGQQQRIAIARALAPKPALILADEPTANLDTENGKQVMQIMEKLNKDTGVTFVFATHDPRVIQYAHRVVTLRDGQIVENNGNGK